jgi:hypothetical protein
MKVAIYAPVALWEVHLAQAVEIAHAEHEKGNEVIVIHCRGSLASCAANMSHEEIKCGECRFQTRFSNRNHFPSDTKHVFLKKIEIDSTTSKLISQLDSLESVKRFVHCGHPFGLSVFSHLVTEERDWEVSFNRVRMKALEMLTNSVQHFYGMKDILDDDIDTIYIFGGRRAGEAFAAFAAISKGIKIKYFEHGSQIGKYWITENKFFTLRGIKNEINSWKENYWKYEIQAEQRKEESEQYFFSLRSLERTDPYFKPFLLGYDGIPQVSGVKPLLVVFTSSLWEFAGFDEFLDCPTDFQNQYLLYKRIGTDRDLLETYEVVFRWHPALKVAGPSERKSMHEVIKLTSKSIHIKPSDPISSYKLLNLADVVVTIGSTIGIEASVLNKPSILLGNASYSGLGSVYEPKSYGEFKTLLKDIPPPLPQDGALVYGDWVSNYGESFKFVHRRGIHYFFNGSRIEKRTVKYRMKRWFFELRNRLGEVY